MVNSLLTLAPQLVALVTLGTGDFGRFSIVYLLFAWGASLQMSVVCEPVGRDHRRGLRDGVDRDYRAVATYVALFAGTLAGIASHLLWHEAAITGVFALARLGLMDGYRCCVSWFHHQDFLAEFDRMRPVSDQIFVVDRDRLSCSGGVSAAHLAAFLIDRHLGGAAARKALSILMIDEPMEGDRPQPGLPLELNARDPLVRRALLAMQQNLHAPLPIARIARDLGVGRRKLERHFNADLGLPPADASARIRLAQARMLLARTDRTVTRIAEETGFCDASHLIRVFRETEGTTPDLWRQERARNQPAEE